jgi:hypothetical protein
MKQPKYSPQEALERVKLMMKYDMGKTLNENRELLSEQVNNPEYFNTVTKSIMKNPSQVKNINFGNPTVNVKNAVTQINKAVSGIGTDFKGITFVLDNGFKDIANSMAIIKSYPEIGGESLFDALNGELFGGFKMNDVIKKVSEQIETWCQGKTNISICKIKTSDELKYGKI